MADNVRFLSGGIGNLDKQPITPGNIYFALSDDKTYGYIVYDFKDSDNSNSRIVMSAKAKTAGQVEFPLVIGEHSYDGSERIEIPIYDGSSESGSECFDISILDNMLVFDNDKIWLFKDGKIDKTAPVDFGLAANESIKALSDRLNNIESNYLTTTDKDQVVTMVSNEALERKAQIGDVGDKTVKKYVDDKTYEVDTKIDKLNNSISSEATARQAADDVLTARMDTFTSLAEGSTAGDAELTDIRVKADGTVAISAGNAVREQISELKGDLAQFEETMKTNVYSEEKFLLNGFDETDVTENRYIDYIEGGVHYVESSAWNTCNKILEIKPNTIYTVWRYDSDRIWKEGNYHIAVFLDKNEEPILRTLEQTVTSPSNAKYVILCYQKVVHLVFTEGTSQPPIGGYAYRTESYSPILEDAKTYTDEKTQGFQTNNSNILYGKSLVCCGDSITYGEDMDADGFSSNGERMTYGWQIANRNGMTFDNRGISGSTMQDISGHNGFSHENGRYTQLPDNIDYLTIWFGWNDATYGTLGNINDTDPTVSYCGGFNTVLPYLINKYPYAKICLCCAYGSSEGHKNAVRQLADKWGVACFDMYGSGTPLYYEKDYGITVDESIIASNRAKFQALGAHPNYRGHYEISTRLENFLRSL